MFSHYFRYKKTEAKNDLGNCNLFPTHTNKYKLYVQTVNTDKDTKIRLMVSARHKIDTIKQNGDSIKKLCHIESRECKEKTKLAKVVKYDDTFRGALFNSLLL